VLAELHLAEDTFALHLPLQRFEGLIDIVIANENLHAVLLFESRGLTAACEYANQLPGRTCSNRPIRSRRTGREIFPASSTVGKFNWLLVGLDHTFYSME
jgi:hypothetical protein